MNAVGRVRERAVGRERAHLEDAQGLEDADEAAAVARALLVVRQAVAGLPEAVTGAAVAPTLRCEEAGVVA